MGETQRRWRRTVSGDIPYEVTVWEPNTPNGRQWRVRNCVNFISDFFSDFGVRYAVEGPYPNFTMDESRRAYRDHTEFPPAA